MKILITVPEGEENYGKLVLRDNSTGRDNAAVQLAPGMKNEITIAGHTDLVVMVGETFTAPEPSTEEA